LPKVLLHEHLDGVLRPQRSLTWQRKQNTPTFLPAIRRRLAQWFHQGSEQGGLAKYLKGFAHTIAVMQKEGALERVAYEQAEDLSQDAWSTLKLASRRSFTPQRIDAPAVISAVLKGLERAERLWNGLRIDHLRHAQYGCIARMASWQWIFLNARGRLRPGGERRVSAQEAVDAFHYIQAAVISTSRFTRGYGKNPSGRPFILRSASHRTRTG